MPHPASPSHILRGVPVAAALFVFAGVGCGDDGVDGSGGQSGTGSETGSTQAGGASDPGGELEVFKPDVAPLPGQTECVVEVRTNIPIASAAHLEICTPIAYATNPPSGGNHWPRWAAFTTYDAPVHHEMLVHDLEHGAIVMLHHCDGCGTAITDAFTKAQNDQGIDQKCIAGGVTSRFVVAPDPSLAFPLAMAAWGATYNATCVDPPSIAAFVAEHYAKGTEDICAPGVDPAVITCD